MKCENCEVEHEGTYGSGRFCSNKCARGFSTKNKRSLINEKVSLKLKGSIPPNKGISNYILIDIICPNCQTIFKQKNHKQKLCSQICHRQYTTDEIKLKISLSVQENVKNGTHNGWQSRKIRSYAEKFFEVVLNNNDLKYSTEYKISKKSLGLNCNSNYFLDFYFEDIKLDLEIDGKQHSYPERIISDQIRDNLLQKIGITVYRIKWKNPNNETNKEYIQNEIRKFILYYKILKASYYILKHN